MSELLIQKPGGHIYVATEALRQRKDMHPYEPPKGPEPEPEEAEPEEDTAGQNEVGEEEAENEGAESEDVETLRSLYREKYGKPPPPKMKIDTMKQKIDME